jgi:RNA polymerase sigma factor (sigma-70 family)
MAEQSNGMLPEKEIVEGVKKGDRKAQQALYEHFAPKMLGLCFRYCNALEEAEDVLQEAFIKVFRYIGTYSGEGSLEWWIRRIMVNTALNHLKKSAQYRFQTDVDSLPEFNQPAVAASLPLELDELLGLIRMLPPGYRTIFNLFEVEGYSHPEIAELLKISVNTSKSQLMKARRQLQKWIDEKEMR